MFDWLQDVFGAIGHPGLWRLYRRVFLASLVDEGWRYVVFAVVLWLLLHVLLRKRLAHRLIGDWPRRADLQREIAYSLGTVAVFAAVAAAVLALLVSGRVEIYEDPGKHGLAWFFLSAPLLLVWHDAYSYWTHRLLHTRWLMRHVHAVHHRSRHPSPFAAYAVHPVEALVIGLTILLPLLVLPLNGYVVVAFGILEVARAVYSHAGVETMPRGFSRHWLWGRLATSTHHHLHHEAVRGNYALWFTWWDRWCGTERPDYLERFDAATAPRPRPVEGAGAPA
jgi:sterol desaturase/sphingolipid hydroxylase (fatty acid hydroxylase superfamily)